MAICMVFNLNLIFIYFLFSADPPEHGYLYGIQPYIYLFSADPPEHGYLYGIPAAAFLGGYGYTAYTGAYPDIHQMTYLAAGLCCVGALSGLSSQTTSRIGNFVWYLFCSGSLLL